MYTINYLMEALSNKRLLSNKHPSALVSLYKFRCPSLINTITCLIDALHNSCSKILGKSEIEKTFQFIQFLVELF